MPRAPAAHITSRFDGPAGDNFLLCSDERIVYLRSLDPKTHWELEWGLVGAVEMSAAAAELTVRPPFRLPAHHTRPVHRQASALHAITRPQVYLHSARGERSISCGSAGAGYLALETLERVRALHANARAASRLSAGAPKAHWLD